MPLKVTQRFAAQLAMLEPTRRRLRTFSLLSLVCATAGAGTWWSCRVLGLQNGVCAPLTSIEPFDFLLVIVLPQLLLAWLSPRSSRLPFREKIFIPYVLENIRAVSRMEQPLASDTLVQAFEALLARRPSGAIASFMSGARSSALCGTVSVAVGELRGSLHGENFTLLSAAQGDATFYLLAQAPGSPRGKAIWDVPTWRSLLVEATFAEWPRLVHFIEKVHAEMAAMESCSPADPSTRRPAG